VFFGNRGLRAIVRFSASRVLLTFLLVMPLTTQIDAVLGQEQAGKSSVNPSDDQILLNYALVSKMLVDELYIRQRTGCAPAGVDAPDDEVDSRSIESRYIEVQQYLGNTDIEWSVERQKIRALLEKDVEYRLALLQQCLPFWGGIRSRTPGIPTVHLNAMSELLAELDVLVSESNSLIERIDDLTIDSFKSQGVAEGFQTAIARGRINERRADALQDFSRERRENLILEVGQLNNQRQEFARQQQVLDQRFQQVSDEMQKVVADGIGQALGMPPELEDVVTSVVNGQDLKKALLKAGGAMLGEVGGLEGLEEFQEVFGEYADDIAKLQQTYRDIRDLKTQVETSADLMRGAGRALADGQFDKFVQSGLALYEINAEYLPAEYGNDVNKWKSHWDSVVEATKPVQTMIALGKDIEHIDGRVREAIEREVRDIVTEVETFKDGLPQVLEEVVKGLPDYSLGLAKKELDELKERYGSFADIGKIYVSLLKQIPQTRWDSQSRNLIISVYARTQPSNFLNKIRNQPNGDARIRRLQAAVGAASLSGLQEWLARNPFGDIPGVFVTQPDVFKTPNRIMIGIRTANPDDAMILDADIGDLFDPRALNVSKFASRELANILMPLLSDLTSKNSEIAKRVMVDLPYSDITQVVSILSGRGELNPESMWDAINGRLSSEVKSEARKYLAATVAGQSFLKARKEIASQSGTPVSQFPPSDGGATGQANALTEAALTYAMDAVFPGAGTAVKVVTKVLAGLSEMNHLAKQIATYQNLIRETYRQQIHLMDMAREANLNIRLQGLEQELARLVQDGAASQLVNYQRAIARGRSAKQYARRSIQLRKGLIFYLLERLREEFDQLDRTLGLWIGEAGRPYGTIADLVSSDPYFIRLAVDNDIHLYEWLDRDEEQSRADLQSSLAHWRQLVRLSRDICETYGCLPGNARLGQVAQTGVVPLSSLVDQEQWREFKKWQKAEGVDGPFAFRVFIDRNWTAINPRHENQRVIDVRIGIQSGSKIVPTSQITVLHSGTSFIVSDGEPGTEVLIPVAVSGFDAPTPFQLEELADRWNVERPSRRPLEGYGLFSNWEIELAVSPETLEADEVYLRFAYQFNEPQVTNREADYIVKLTVEDDKAGQPTRTTVWLNRSDFASFSKRASLSSRIQTVFSDGYLQSSISGLPSIRKIDVQNRDPDEWFKAGTVEIEQ